MVDVPATEFVKNFGRYKELAQREPVAITSHGRTSGYFVSEHVYAEYQRLKTRAARRALLVSELSEDAVRAISTSRMDSRHDHLNKLMND